MSADQVLAELARLEGAVRFAILVAAIVIAALGFGAWRFLVKYSEQRAAISAQVASLNDLKRIVEDQTRLVKQIEEEFAFRAWHAREHNALKRAKLESLLHSAMMSYQHAERLRNHLAFSEPDPGMDEADAQLQMLEGLYFPELRTHVFAFRQTCGDAMNVCRDTAMARITRLQALQRGGSNITEWNRIPPTDEEREAIKVATLEAYRRLLDLKEACGRLMIDLLPRAET